MARVLIIEDNGEVRALWVLALTLAGHEVSEAAHGWDGLELVRRWHPRVVLTDLNLPGVHGLDIIRHVRQEQPDIMVIVASGSDRDLEVAQRLGVFRAFSKPVATHRLIAAISGAVLAQCASPASDALPRAGPPAAP